MKTLILKSKALIILSFLMFASCSKNDDTTLPDAQAPSVSYSTTNIDAVFFQTGNSPVPTLNWNGNQGTFSLSTTIPGLSVNTTTGILNWTRDLPMGTHNLQVIATNSVGQTAIDLTINNPLQGIFTGTYDNTNFFEVEFNPNGTLILRAEDPVNPYLASGNWTKNGSTIDLDYTYDGGGDYSLSGTVNTGSSAIYSGNWFYDHGTVSGNEGGVFEMTLD